MEDQGHQGEMLPGNSKSKQMKVKNVTKVKSKAKLVPKEIMSKEISKSVEMEQETLNNNAQVDISAEKSCNKATRNQLAGDVLLAVEGDEFNTDDESLDKGSIVEMEESEEELDYDDIAESEFLPPDDYGMMEGSEVQFNVKKTDSRTGPSAPTTVTSTDDIQSYVQQLFDQKWKERESEVEKHILEKHGISSGSGKHSDNSEGKKGETGQNKQNLRMPVKSPSDTMLYAPALNKIADRNSPRIALNFSKEGEQRVVPTDLIDKISEFVESIRIANKPVQQPQPSTSGKDKERDRMSMAWETVQKVVIQAEQFRAEVATPKGKQLNHVQHATNSPMNLEARTKFLGINNEDGRVLDDDEFFHITCHMDRLLTAKIEQGEYVDLEKLLLVKRFRYKSDDDHLEFVKHEGQTFLAPVQEKEGRINGIRK